MEHSYSQTTASTIGLVD